MPFATCDFCFKNVNEKNLLKVPKIPVKFGKYDLGEEIINPFTYSAQICLACYMDRYCLFCETPTDRRDCPGHEVLVKKGNRFSEDKKFVQDMMFDEDRKRK